MRSISEAEHIRRDAKRFEELLFSFARYQSLRNPMSDIDETELTPQQVNTLFQLGREGALQMGELARMCGITEKTITGVVDRLEREKYVQRLRDSADRRVVRVQLSHKGAAAHRRVRNHLLLKLNAFMELLDPGDRRDLLRVMENLLERMKARSGGHTEARKAVS